jgi:LysR family carnitine catabolism transcriptional activator
MTELGATCIELDGPVIQRRIGVLRSAHHKLSTASGMLVDAEKGVSRLKMRSQVM